MSKLYCMSVKHVVSGKKSFNIATVCSSYGFIQDVFVDDDLYEFIDDQLDTTGFVDVSDYFQLQYDKKLDKLVYVLIRNR